MVFGQLEIKTIMHRLLRRYRLELARPGYEPRYDYGGMPVPMDGMPIVLRPSALRRGQQAVRTRDDGAQRRLRRVRVKAHRPLGVCSVAPPDERRRFVAARELVEAVISTGMPCAYSISVRAATGPEAAAEATLIRSPIARVAW